MEIKNKKNSCAILIIIKRNTFWEKYEHEIRAWFETINNEEFE